MCFSNPRPTSSSQANAKITIPKRNPSHPNPVNPLSQEERGKSEPLEERGASSIRTLPSHLLRKYHHQFQSETSHSLTSTLSQSHFFPFTLPPPSTVQRPQIGHISSSVSKWPPDNRRFCVPERLSHHAREIGVTALLPSRHPRHSLAHSPP